MSPVGCFAALAKIRADKGLPPKPIWHPNPTERKRLNAAAASVVSSPGNTTISYAEVANPHPTPKVVSDMTQHSTAPPTAPPPVSSFNTLRQVLSSTQTPTPVSSANPSTTKDLLSIDGHFYWHINSTSISYNLSNHASNPVLSFLIDGSANGGMAGNDVCTLSESTFSKANVMEIGQSLIQDLPLASIAGLVTTHRGPAIVILNQYATYGKGHTIHSSSQLHAFGTLVHVAPRYNGGCQHLVTPDGYHIPLCYRSGLSYMDMRPPGDNEMETLPHILLTGDNLWNPSCIDDEFSIADLCLDAPADTGNQDPRVNDIGDYTGNIDEDIDLIIHQCRTEHLEREDHETIPNFLEHCINQHTVSKAKPNLEALCPNFGWLPI
jgi:hypothetical protein